MDSKKRKYSSSSLASIILNSNTKEKKIKKPTFIEAEDISSDSDISSNERSNSGLSTIKSRQKLISPKGIDFNFSSESESESEVDDDDVPLSIFKEYTPLPITEEDILKSFELKGIEYKIDNPPLMAHELLTLNCIDDDKYYVKDRKNPYNLLQSENLKNLLELFNEKIIEKLINERALQPETKPFQSDNNTCECESDSDDDHELVRLNQREKKTKKNVKKVSSKREQIATYEVLRKRSYSAGMNKEIVFNEPGQKNNGAFCYCSKRHSSSGMRHGYYPNEKPIPKCNFQSNEIDKLHHYILKIKTQLHGSSYNQTVINYNNTRYCFEGFSLFFHQNIPKNVTQCFEPVILEDGTVIEYELVSAKNEIMYTVGELEYFYQYFFVGIMEMYDLHWFPKSCKFPNTENISCKIVHVLPRFINDNTILSMANIIKWMIDTFKPVCTPDVAVAVQTNVHALTKLRRNNIGKIVVNFNLRPCAIRVDDISTIDTDDKKSNKYPKIYHRTTKIPEYSHVHAIEYQETKERANKLQSKLDRRGIISEGEKYELKQLNEILKDYKNLSGRKKCREVSMSSNNYFCTNICSDMIEHAVVLISVISLVRFNNSLDTLEKEKLKYTFKDRRLLKLSLTHVSKFHHMGTNPDHIKNVLRNLGYKRQKNKNEFINSREKRRERDIAMQINRHPNNERLEYLGDTVLEVIVTHHLFLTLPDIQEGGMATFRSAMVQNRNLASLASKLMLDHYMLYAHGPDLCNETDFRHAMANTFEAVIGAMHLDGGTRECKNIIGSCIFDDCEISLKLWNSPPMYNLQAKYKDGDRHLCEKYPYLNSLQRFEKEINIFFKNIRILAQVFCRTSLCKNALTEGDNERLEFLGDAVLQLVITEYLYQNFPDRDEGYMSQLRTCLVSNKTQACVCDDLGLQRYIMPSKPNEDVCSIQMKMKDKADLVEALIGALFIDRGIDICRLFIREMFMSRLHYFKDDMTWKDPKSYLQQYCLSKHLKPDGSSTGLLPKYKVLKKDIYNKTHYHLVAVYFNDIRVGRGLGSNIVDAAQAASSAALEYLERKDVQAKVFKFDPNRDYSQA
ncbi:Drosha [Strongyloides ratti]|uniref:Drosha n=1 Tax=Strongyloides ratti TaxID=34506 RepID=A0A090L593_STRRB|nr:Drosha [Strongyloides ratti]CEF63257.1 Drosha [Strongyloides ratti]